MMLRRPRVRPESCVAPPSRRWGRQAGRLCHRVWGRNLAGLCLIGLLALSVVGACHNDKQIIEKHQQALEDDE